MNFEIVINSERRQVAAQQRWFSGAMKAQPVAYQAIARDHPFALGIDVKGVNRASQPDVIYLWITMFSLVKGVPLE